MKYSFQNGAVYISILSHSEVSCILVKSLKIRKMARPGPQTVEILRSVKFKNAKTTAELSSWKCYGHKTDKTGFCIGFRSVDGKIFKILLG